MMTRRNLSRIAAPLCTLALLTACKDEPAAPTPENETQAAEGDVLKGSISDEMLPLDTITSQSPAAKATNDPKAPASAPNEAADIAADPVIAENGDDSGKETAEADTQ
ncbi:hypothetical protein GCM10023115_55420 [Pontixanthobacter gangjinensis]|uniref:Lipoprotein n=1 Tax=Pontixanthobacter gangjinensis TaxID=1028742 RepID=A0A6I4SPR9_9SPHN|nr:hypothetical protein [Pontixanthobacter gangjinensis]MXO57823.1 hypothetical protein [Pontixanthobacter gangjinensis]